MMGDDVGESLGRTPATDERGETPADSTSWAQLSGQSFGRDWDSEEARVYDRRE